MMIEVGGQYHQVDKVEYDKNSDLVWVWITKSGEEFGYLKSDVRVIHEEEAAYQTFLKTVNTTIEHGAKDKEEAIKWILEAEELIQYYDKEPDYICYKLGLSYDKEYLFKKKH